MNPLKVAAAIAVIAVAGKACAVLSDRSQESIANNARPQGDLCSPTYAAARYEAEHEDGIEVNCEDEQ